MHQDLRHEGPRVIISASNDLPPMQNLEFRRKLEVFKNRLFSGVGVDVGIGRNNWTDALRSDFDSGFNSNRIKQISAELFRHPNGCIFGRGKAQMPLNQLP